MPNILGKAMKDCCPICEGEIKGSCRCFRRDSTCENGHEWHTCTVHNVYVEGHSDHSLDTSSCTCGFNDLAKVGKPKFSVDPEGISLVEGQKQIARFSPEEAYSIGLQLIEAAKDDYSRAMEEMTEERLSKRKKKKGK